MMVVVAVAGAIFSSASTLVRRRDRFAGLRDYHASRAPYMFLGAIDSPEMRRQDWHWEMLRKYARAAHHPWLPVVPDPPEPE